MSGGLSRKERGVLVAVVLLTVVSGRMVDVVGIAAWVGLLTALLIGWRHVPGFWRMVWSGVAGGALAGVLILGPGLRLAMRAVAILDPVRTPEFTLEGTLFIMIVVGAFLGGIIGLGAALLRQAMALSGPVAAAGMTVVIMGLLLVDSELRAEFVDLGAGPWLNIPMFGAVVLLYAVVANRWSDRFLARKPGRATMEPVEVQA